MKAGRDCSLRDCGGLFMPDDEHKTD